jgi:hypothetical protein
MYVLNKKSRMVSFRLSPLEFSSAKEDCDRRGVRSVSGLARRALLGVIAQHHPDPHSALFGEASINLPVDLPVDLKLERLRIEISDLRAQLNRLRQTLLPWLDLSATPASPSVQKDAPGTGNRTPSTVAASTG